MSVLAVKPNHQSKIAGTSLVSARIVASAMLLVSENGPPQILTKFVQLSVKNEQSGWASCMKSQSHAVLLRIAKFVLKLLSRTAGTASAAKRHSRNSSQSIISKAVVMLTERPSLTISTAGSRTTDFRKRSSACSATIATVPWRTEGTVLTSVGNTLTIS